MLLPSHLEGSSASAKVLLSKANVNTQQKSQKGLTDDLLGDTMVCGQCGNHTWLRRTDTKRLQHAGAGDDVRHCHCLYGS